LEIDMGVPTGYDGDAHDREVARLAAVASNKALQFPDDTEAEILLWKTRNEDPFPEIPPALLNSADIIDYVLATGMIAPFNPDKVKTASYEVGVLGPYVLLDEFGQLHEGVLAKDEEFVLPRNSIVFMSAEPYFRLPDYIALRHNLKIKHVYKGLLVGTGPLIDPGFVGRLSLPLHNLTEHDYTIVGGEGMIWVEFTKLSPHESWNPKLKRGGKRVGSYTSFPANKTEDRTVRDYILDATGLLGTPSSSSAAIDQRANEAIELAQSTDSRVGRLQLTGFLAIVALTITLLLPIQIQLWTIQNRQDDLIRQLQQQIFDLEQADEDPGSSPAPAPLTPEPPAPSASPTTP
jgi:deoxycytidine triphosphate deaminase